MIQAVIFDLDGTLLNRDASLRTFIDGQYERLNEWVGHIPKDQYKSRFIELDCRGYIWKDKVFQQLVCEFDMTAISWTDLLKDYIAQFKNSCVPFPHLIKMLEELNSKNLILGMITNGKGQFQIDNLRALGIEKYFETILVSEWEGIKKPDALLFKRALAHLNVLPNESIYVGDHPENDIKAAQCIGMKAIWKKDCQWKNVNADFIVDDLAEIPFIIDRLGN